MTTVERNADDLTLEPASGLDLDALIRLLSSSHLPVADLESHLAAFTLAKRAGIVVGSAGLESYGELALLRSLCVAEEHRSKRIGVKLVSAVESQACAQGVRDLYLLTNGAASYFANLGFVPIDRSQAPLEIRNTAQFSAWCPASAVCMHRTIGRPLEPAGNSSAARRAG
ncbi:MAG TPA: arsenic resistance N-acetyltransferase ArsN2 [Polyangiaceae bacterium]